MAFCTSCGAQVSDASQFCTKCGKPLPAVASQPAATPGNFGAPGATAGTAPRGGSNAFTIAVIIIAVVVALGLVAAGITGVVLHRIARHSRVTTTEGGARVETPFGTIQTTTDASKLSSALKEDFYPGATMQEGGSEVNLGGKHIMSANLATSDSPDKVADYYKEKYPRSIRTEEEGKHSIVYKDGGELVTIAIEAEGGKTLIHISHISR